MEAKDHFHVGENFKWLCREHLMENFNKNFLAYPDKMVIFHPELEKVCKNLYSYYPVSKMSEFSFDKVSIKSIENLLGTITERCRECGSESRVLYFPKGAVKYESYNPLVEKIHPR